jgi:hypothetical protein
MSLSISRANLPGSGAPKITYKGVTIWTRADLMIPLKQSLKQQVSSMYGPVTFTRDGRAIEFEVPIYGFWNSLSVLFPSYLLAGIHGSRIFGTSDTPMTFVARNGDAIHLTNVQLVAVTNLKLKANEQIFSGNAKFVALIGNNKAPTTGVATISGNSSWTSYVASPTAAYYALATGVTYAEGDFPQSNFKSLAWTGAWGSRTGYTNILTQDGWDVDWAIKFMSPDDLVDGIGPVDKFYDSCLPKISAIVVGPTLAQIDTGIDFQGTNAAVGADIAADSDPLVLTDGTSTLTLAVSSMIETGVVFAPGKKRIAKTTWQGTLGFTSGAPNAMATVA